MGCLCGVCGRSGLRRVLSLLRRGRWREPAGHGRTRQSESSRPWPRGITDTLPERRVEPCWSLIGCVGLRCRSSWPLVLHTPRVAARKQRPTSRIPPARSESSPGSMERRPGRDARPDLESKSSRKADDLSHDSVSENKHCTPFSLVRGGVLLFCLALSSRISTHRGDRSILIARVITLGRDAHRASASPPALILRGVESVQKSNRPGSQPGRSIQFNASG